MRWTKEQVREVAHEKLNTVIPRSGLAWAKDPSAYLEFARKDAAYQLSRSIVEKLHLDVCEDDIEFNLESKSADFTTETYVSWWQPKNRPCTLIGGPANGKLLSSFGPGLAILNIDILVTPRQVYILGDHLEQVFPEIQATTARYLLDGWESKTRSWTYVYDENFNLQWRQ